MGREIKVGERRIYTLAYAERMAKGEDKMRSMIYRLERYLYGKGLEVNTEKTKIMRFKNGGRRMRKGTGDEKERG